jgi:hypothetical protein
MRTHLFLLALLPSTLFNAVQAIRGSRDKGLAEPEAKIIHQDIEGKHLEGFDKLVEGERALFDDPVQRELARKFNSTVQGVQTYTCTAAELKAIRPVVNRVRQNSAKLRSCFDKNSTAVNFKHLVIQWFGKAAWSTSLKTTLQTNFAAIQDALHANFSLNCNPDICHDNYVALANLGDKNHSINLCHEFFAIAATYPEETTNCLAHEMSHYENTAQTLDIMYGQADSLALAVSSPSQAVTNADNYGYFVAFANSKTC